MLPSQRNLSDELALAGAADALTPARARTHAHLPPRTYPPRPQCAGACNPAIRTHTADMKMHLASTDYGNFLQNEPSPISSSTLQDKCTVRAPPLLASPPPSPSTPSALLPHHPSPCAATLVCLDEPSCMHSHSKLAESATDSDPHLLSRPRRCRQTTMTHRWCTLHQICRWRALECTRSQERLVDEFNSLRSQAVAPLATFMEYITCADWLASDMSMHAWVASCMLMPSLTACSLVRLVARIACRVVTSHQNRCMCQCLCRW